MLMFWCSTAWMSARFSTPSDCCSSGRTRCTHQTLLSHLSGWVDTSCFGLAKFSFVCSSFVWLRLVWYWSCPFSYFRWKKVFKIIHSIREFSNEICGQKKHRSCWHGQPLYKSDLIRKVGLPNSRRKCRMESATKSLLGGDAEAFVAFVKKLWGIKTHWCLMP